MMSLISFFQFSSFFLNYLFNSKKEKGKERKGKERKREQREQRDITMSSSNNFTDSKIARENLGKLPGELKKRPKPSASSRVIEELKAAGAGAPLASFTEEQASKLAGPNVDLSPEWFKLQNINALHKYLSSTIQFLDLSDNDLTALDNLPESSKLKHFFANNNSISAINFNGFRNVEYMAIANNKISGIPNNVEAMKKVVYLDLSHNTIISGFDKLSKLKTLKVLDLSYNDINMTLPEFHK